MKAAMILECMIRGDLGGADAAGDCSGVEVHAPPARHGVNLTNRRSTLANSRWSSGREGLQADGFREGGLARVVGHKRACAEFQRGGHVQDIERARAERDRVSAA